MTTPRFLISLDLDSFDHPRRGELSFKTISYLNYVHAVVTPETVSTASDFIQCHYHECIIYLDVTNLGDNIPKIIELLNDGATKLFVTSKQLEAIASDHSFSAFDRCILSLDSDFCKEDSSAVASKISSDLRNIVGDVEVAVQVPDAHDWKLLDSIKHTSTTVGFSTIYVPLYDNIQDEYHRALRHGQVAIVPARSLTAAPQGFSSGQMPIKDLIIATIQSDRPDGLYPTVVVNEHNQCLGLVYSSENSIEEALRQGRGVYKSRKRDGVWVKGETSGDWQELISIDWDCDGDALRFTVRQKGDGKLDRNLARLTFTNSIRILSFKDSYLLRIIQRVIETRTNTTISKILISSRLIHSKTIQRVKVTGSEDYGGG